MTEDRTAPLEPIPERERLEKEIENAKAELDRADKLLAEEGDRPTYIHSLESARVDADKRIRLAEFGLRQLDSTSVVESPPEVPEPQQVQAPKKEGEGTMIQGVTQGLMIIIIAIWLAIASVVTVIVGYEMFFDDGAVASGSGNQVILQRDEGPSPSSAPSAYANWLCSDPLGQPQDGQFKFENCVREP